MLPYCRGLLGCGEILSLNVQPAKPLARMTPKPTIIDVAQLAGVSFKTVSRVINNEPNVSARTRQRIRAAIAELGFEASSAAREMRRQKPERSHILAHFYGDQGGVYTLQIQLGMLTRCRANGCSLMVQELDYRSPDAEMRLRNVLRRNRPDGVVVSAPLTDDELVIRVLNEAGVPFVPISPLRELDNIPSVGMDERRAVYQLTQHLLSYGHRRIGFLRGLPNHAGTPMRFEGFSRAMREAGVPIDPTLVEDGEFRNFVATRCAYRMLTRDDRPTAIVASSDEMAAAVIKVAHELAIKMPDDLSVVGFDDFATAEVMYPALTTVRHPVEKFGAAAADLLLGHLERAGASWPNPAPHLTIQHDIVLRESIAPCRRKSSVAVQAGRKDDRTRPSRIS